MGDSKTALPQERLVAPTSEHRPTTAPEESQTRAPKRKRGRSHESLDECASSVRNSRPPNQSPTRSPQDCLSPAEMAPGTEMDSPGGSDTSRSSEACTTAEENVLPEEELEEVFATSIKNVLDAAEKDQQEFDLICSRRWLELVNAKIKRDSAFHLKAQLAEWAQRNRNMVHIFERRRTINREMVERFESLPGGIGIAGELRAADLQRLEAERLSILEETVRNQEEYTHIQKRIELNNERLDLKTRICAAMAHRLCEVVKDCPIQWTRRNIERLIEEKRNVYPEGTRYAERLLRDSAVEHRLLVEYLHKVDILKWAESIDEPWRIDPDDSDPSDV